MKNILKIHGKLLVVRQKEEICCVFTLGKLLTGEGLERMVTANGQARGRRYMFQ